MTRIAMRVKIKLILILVIFLGSCVVLTSLIMSRKPRGDEETVSEHIQPETTVGHQDSWPMFRGGQQLLGRASGSLPDSLIIAGNRGQSCFYWLI